MSDAVIDASAGMFLAQLDADLDGLTALELTRSTADELLVLTRGLEQFTRRLPVVQHALIAQLTDRGVAVEQGCRSTAELLRVLLRLHPGEAKARVEAAAALGPQRSLTGEPLEPVFAATATAQAQGTISPAHARLIVDTVEALPVAIRAEYDLQVEGRLLEQAALIDPALLARAAQQIVANLDPDGTAPRDEDHRRRRGLTISTNRDGSGTISGRLTPACLAVTRAWVDALSAPTPGPDGSADPRTAGQRLHDGLEEAGLRLLTDGGLPATGGAPTTLLITMTAEQLRDGIGLARTGHGDLLTVTEALRLADQADIATATVTANGAVLDLGRDRRTASPAQRLALAARDRGCSFPGCTHPPSRCQSHHVIAWQDGGKTDLDNLALVCKFHHLYFERLSFTCTMTDGLPHWTAPPWLDPTQTPQVNTAH